MGYQNIGHGLSIREERLCTCRNDRAPGVGDVCRDYHIYVLAWVAYKRGERLRIEHNGILLKLRVAFALKCTAETGKLTIELLYLMYQDPLFMCIETSQKFILFKLTQKHVY